MLQTSVVSSCSRRGNLGRCTRLMGARCDRQQIPSIAARWLSKVVIGGPEFFMLDAPVATRV